MKFLRFGLAAVLLAAVMLGSRAFTPAPDAQAAPIGVYIVSRAACLTLMVAAGGGNEGVCAGAVQGVSSNTALFAADLGDKDDVLEPEDIATLDGVGGDGGQLHESDMLAFVFIFVNDDDHVLIRTDTDGGTILTTLSAASPAGNEWICNTSGADEDCDNDGVEGDGLIVVGLCGGNGDPYCDAVSPAAAPFPPADRGEHELRVQQEGIAVDTPYTVVGEPDSIVFQLFETTLGEGIEDLNDDGDFGDKGECPLDLSTAGFTEALGQAAKTIMFARVKDDDGTDISGAWINWTADSDDDNVPDDDGGVFATTVIPSLFLGAFGIGSPNIFCGTGKSTVTIKATILTGPTAVIQIDVNAEDDSKTATLTVFGEPASAASVATPASIACDGVSSAELAVTVLDKDGDKVANGTEVRFTIKVLGTANPIVATTTDGVAKSVITPLAIKDTGAPVRITTGDVETSALVNCGASTASPTGGGAAPGGPPAPGGAPRGTIGGPDTGNGGYLSRQGGTALPLWPAIPVVALIALLVAGRVHATSTTRR